jgi:hypothetical protein
MARSHRWRRSGYATSSAAPVSAGAVEPAGNRPRSCRRPVAYSGVRVSPTSRRASGFPPRSALSVRSTSSAGVDLQPGLQHARGRPASRRSRLRRGRRGRTRAPSGGSGPSGAGQRIRGAVVPVLRTQLCSDDSDLKSRASTTWIAGASTCTYYLLVVGRSTRRAGATLPMRSGWPASAVWSSGGRPLPVIPPGGNG